MPKNSTKNQQKRPGIFPGSIFALICTRVRVPASRVCARLRALSSRGRTKRRVPSANVKRLAPALRVMVSHTPFRRKPIRAINANREKNPGLFHFEKNILEFGFELILVYF